MLAATLLVRSGIAQTFSTSPSLKFIPNRGQLSDQNGNPMPEVLYTLEGAGVKTYFTKGSMHYVFSHLQRGDHPLTPSLKRRGDPTQQEKDTLSLYRVDVHFIGANKNVEIVPEDATEDYTNYYLASCPNGITGVHGFRRITYRNLYPHIDFVLYQNEKKTLEYDFVVHPGGNPKAIRMHYDHATALSVDESGALQLSSPFGTIEDSHPNAYQLRGEVKRAVQSGFKLGGTDLTISTGHFDKTRDLILDPQRLWGTYFAGFGADSSTYIQDLAIDRGGNIDIAGFTNSANIATTGAFQTTFAGGLYDGIVARFGPDGSPRWITYYGGNQTLGPPALDGNDVFNGIASDTSLGMIAVGSTGSSSGITTSGAFQSTFTGGRDAMLVSFDSTGARRWATYYSGNGLTPPDSKGHIGASTTTGNSVATDSAGNIILVGTTMSTAGIATSGAYQTSLTRGINGNTFDLFLVKFTSGGSRLWATYFGGEGDENSGWVNVDPNNDIYFTASTASSTKIATTNAFQTTYGPICFGKFSPTGSLDWATYFLGNAKGLPGEIAVDRSGNIFFTASDTNETGIATAGAFQTAPGKGYDGVFGKFNTNGNRIWASYYGGAGDDQLFGIALDSSDDIFAGGMTASLLGIASVGEYQTTLLGPFDPFLIKLDSSGHKRYWGTYYGRRGWIQGIGLDRGGHPIVGGSTQVTGINTEFSSSGAYQTLPAGYNNGFIAKFCDPINLHISSSVSSPDTICPGSPMSLSTRTGLASYQWISNGTNIGGATVATYNFNAPKLPGHYVYTVTGEGTDGCNVISDTFSVFVRQPPFITTLPSFSTCPGMPVKLTDTATGLGHLTYSWSPKTGLDYPDSLQPNASPLVATTYTLSVTDSLGCTATQKIIVSTYPQIKITISANQSICSGSSVQLNASASGGFGAFTYSWSPSGTLNRSDTDTVIASPIKTTKYYVTVTDVEGCTSIDSVTITVNALPIVTAGAPLSICKGSSIKIGAQITGGLFPYKAQWTPTAGLSNPGTLNPTASPDSTTRYTVFVTDKNGCASQDSVLITVSDSLIPSVKALGPTTLCAGDSVTLDAGTGYASYLWSDQEKTSTIVVKQSGSYSVHVSNGSGCSGTSQPIAITVLPDSIPHPILTASRTTICEGDSVVVSTKESYANYLWSTGDTTSTIVVSKTDTVTVRATNPGGCAGTSKPLAITVLPVPAVAITSSGSQSLCSGESVILSATSGYPIYRWSTGDSTASIRVNVSGTYSVAATNAGGCSGISAPVDVSVYPTPTPTISGPFSVCPNSTGTYSVPYVAADTYSWSLTPASAGAMSDPSSATMTIQWTASGTAVLTLIETTPAGCSDTVHVSVSINSNLSPVITGPKSFCSGDTITLDAGAGYASYQWSENGNQIAGATSEALSVSQSGSYSVYVTSSGGCSGTSAPYAVSADSVTKPLIAKIGTKLVTATAFRYQWLRNGVPLTDSTSSSITYDSGGTYAVVVSDSLGCSAESDPFVIASKAWAAVSVDDHLAAPGSQVTIHLQLDSSANLQTGTLNYTATLDIDATMLTPVNPTGTLVTTPKGMRWQVPVSGTVPAAPGAMGSITATALDSGLCSSVTIDSLSFSGSGVQGILSNGTVCLTGICRSLITSEVNASYIKGIIPNPASSQFSVAYHLKEKGPVEISVQDYLGRTIGVLKNEWSDAGDMLETYSSSAISSGLYRLILQSDGEVQSTVLVIAK